MATVFSRQLLLLAPGATGSFTVPAGTTAVIRCITARNASSSAAQSYAVAIEFPKVFICQGMLPAFNYAPGEASSILDLRVVVEAGQTIVTSNDPQIEMSISGYLFGS